MSDIDFVDAFEFCQFRQSLNCPKGQCCQVPVKSGIATGLALLLENNCMTLEKRRPVALVIGVAAGLGTSICTTLARAGYQVVGIARSNRVETDLSRNIEADGGFYKHVICDVGEADQVAQNIDEIEAALGPIDVAVCNAHQLLIKPFDQTGPAEFESVWRNSCFGAMSVAHAVIPHMVSRGKGTIIFTGATAALRGGARFSAFASAKFALRGLAQSLAREYGSSGVHVVHCLLDGLIWEPQTVARFNPDRESCMEPEAIAKAYLDLIQQDKSVWSHEIDFRPFGEKF